MPEKEPIFDQENLDDERGKISQDASDIAPTAEMQDSPDDEEKGIMGKIGEKVHKHPYVTSAALMGTGVAMGAVANQSGTVHETVDPVLEKVGLHSPSQAEYLSGLKKNEPAVFENVINNEAMDRAGGQNEWGKLSTDEQLKIRSQVAIEYNDLAEGRTEGPSIQKDEAGNVSGVRTTDGTQYEVDLPQ